MEQSDDPAAANTLYRLGVLDRTDIFRALPAELMLELIERACVARYAPGETIIWQGERNDDVYVLLEGSLDVSVTRGGKPVHVGTITAGEVFGEMAFFTREPRTATVSAIDAAKCFVLKDFELQMFALKHPTLLIRMAGAMAKRLSEAVQLGRRGAAESDPLIVGGG
jgi:CRP-like cAMP-binding protein